MKKELFRQFNPWSNGKRLVFQQEANKVAVDLTRLEAVAQAELKGAEIRKDPEAIKAAKDKLKTVAEIKAEIDGNVKTAKTQEKGLMARAWETVTGWMRKERAPQAPLRNRPNMGEPIHLAGINYEKAPHGLREDQGADAFTDALAAYRQLEADLAKDKSYVPFLTEHGFMGLIDGEPNPENIVKAVLARKYPYSTLQDRDLLYTAVLGKVMSQPQAPASDMAVARKEPARPTLKRVQGVEDVLSVNDMEPEMYKLSLISDAKGVAMRAAVTRKYLETKGLTLQEAGLNLPAHLFKNDAKLVSAVLDLQERAGLPQADDKHGKDGMFGDGIYNTAVAQGLIPGKPDTMVAKKENADKGSPKEVARR